MPTGRDANMSRTDALTEDLTEDQTGDSAVLAAAISSGMRQKNLTLAVAESLTSGALASTLGAAEAASEWFRGGLIAYASEVKFELLHVPEGPVVTAECARQMAVGVADLLRADIGLALTGVGGPGPVEGRPAGTVFLAVQGPGIDRVDECRFPGDPTEVVRAATLHGLRMLGDADQL
jgi:nicotinamide-nucleotide amidase